MTRKCSAKSRSTCAAGPLAALATPPLLSIPPGRRGPTAAAAGRLNVRCVGAPSPAPLSAVPSGPSVPESVGKSKPARSKHPVLLDAPRSDRCVICSLRGPPDVEPDGAQRALACAVSRGSCCVGLLRRRAAQTGYAPMYKRRSVVPLAKSARRTPPACTRRCAATPNAGGATPPSGYPAGSRGTAWHATTRRPAKPARRRAESQGDGRRGLATRGSRGIRGSKPVRPRRATARAPVAGRLLQEGHQRGDNCTEQPRDVDDGGKEQARNPMGGGPNTARAWACIGAGPARDQQIRLHRIGFAAGGLGEMRDALSV